MRFLRPVFILFILSFVSMAIAESPEFKAGKTIFVDADTGHDSHQCGREESPCKTINQGIYRARQVQDDPVAADQPSASNIVLDVDNLVTVQVGPGTYNEAVLLSSEWVRLLGAGPGLSIITTSDEPTGNVWDRVPLLVRGAHPVWIEGFTFANSQEWNAGALAFRSGAYGFVRNCSFVGNKVGLDVGFSSSASVWESTFTDNHDAAWVREDSYLSLSGFEMSGIGTENFSAGVFAWRGSIAHLNPGSEGDLANQISNFEFGVAAWASSRVQVDEIEISGNRIGIDVSEDSFLNTGGSDIADNDKGVFLSQFSNGVIAGSTNFHDNGDDIGTDGTSDYLY